MMKPKAVIISIDGFIVDRSAAVTVTLRGQIYSILG